jgi:DNA repair exonuclease SbcCD ATPase subunit
MIEFKTIKWRNFLSTGNNYTTIDLNSHNKTLIIGENGAGKSTILDALCFGLFNKPFRKINKPQLVNSINSGDLKVEIEFTVGNINWKIVRGIKPTVFEIYKDGKKLDQAAATNDQQKWLEQNVLKLNYKSFTQIVVLGSSTFVPFMQLPAAGRREVIEDILDIRIFSTMNVILKDRVKVIKEEVGELEYAVSILKEKVEVQRKYIQNLKDQSQQNIEEKENNISILEESIRLKKNDADNYEGQLNSLNDKIKEYADVDIKINKLKEYDITFSSKIKELSKEQKFFTNHASCPTCNQEISQELKDAKVLETSGKIEKFEKALEKLDSDRKEVIKLLSKKNEILDSISSTQSKIREALKEVEWNEKRIKDILAEIESINSNGDLIDAETEKTKTLIEQGKSQELQRRKLIKKQTELKIIADILKDGGVKSTIIRKYLPVMNTLINKYLQELEFYVNFNLDDTFNETIKSRFRDEFSYASFSEGEKMRIDLALLFTWREVAKLKNSVNTNLLILDEVFDSSLDSNGTADFINILRNITEGNNVFVISHKQDILHDKFDTVIQFKKVKNFSKPFQSNDSAS